MSGDEVKKLGKKKGVRTLDGLRSAAVKSEKSKEQADAPKTKSKAQPNRMVEVPIPELEKLPDRASVEQKLAEYAKQLVLTNAGRFKPVLKKDVEEPKKDADFRLKADRKQGDPFIVLPKFGSVPNPIVGGNTKVDVGSNEWFWVLDQMRTLGTMRSVVYKTFIQPSMEVVEKDLGGGASSVKDWLEGGKEKGSCSKRLESMLLWFPKEGEEMKRRKEALDIIMDKVRGVNPRAFLPRMVDGNPVCPPERIDVTIGDIVVEDFAQNFTTIKKYATGWTDKGLQFVDECRPPPGVPVFPPSLAAEDIALEYGMVEFRYTSGDAFKAYMNTINTIINSSGFGVGHGTKDLLQSTDGLLVHFDVDSRSEGHVGAIIPTERGRAYKVFPVEVHLGNVRPEIVQYPISDTLTLRMWVDRISMRPEDVAPFYYVVLNAPFNNVPPYDLFSWKVNTPTGFSHRMVADAPLRFFRDCLIRKYVPVEKRADVSTCEDIFLDSILKDIKQAAKTLEEKNATLAIKTEFSSSSKPDKEVGEAYADDIDERKLADALSALYRNGRYSSACYDPDNPIIKEDLKEQYLAAAVANPPKRRSLDDIAKMTLNDKFVLASSVEQ